MKTQKVLSYENYSMKTIKLLMIILLNEQKFIFWTKVGCKNNGPNRPNRPNEWAKWA